MSIGPLLSLQDRVTALEQAIAGLQGSEALSPNYLTVDPSGRVSADFTGIVKALGLTLPEGTTSAFASTSAVAWEDTNGNVREFVQGADNGSGTRELTMTVNQDGAGGPAALSVAVNLPLAAAAILAQVGAAQLIVIDTNGNSSFIQNPLGDALALTAGNSSLTFSASNSASTTISHGLPRTPGAVLGTLLAVGSLAFSAILSATSLGASTFIMGGFVPSGPITGTVQFSWLALG